MAQRNVSNITITLSLLSTQGGLYNVRDASGDRDTSLKMACPSCNNSLLDQAYLCKAGCKPDTSAPGVLGVGWKTGEVPNRVRVEGKGKSARLIPVTADEVEAAKATSIEPGTLELAVYPAAEVEAQTGTGGTTYAFVPDKADKVYAMLLNSVRDNTRAFVGVINLRGTEKLYRIVENEGTIRVQELLRPEEVASFAPVRLPDVAEQEAAMFNSIVNTLEDTFDPDMYASSKLTNLRNLLAAKTGNTTPMPSQAPKPIATAVPDQLAVALAMAKAAKAAREEKKAS